ncbi:MAG TPA: sigma-70 family RNA polymerase sigma factor [Longimicrobiales bacterium]|nr:sigma-70 family RNA polymerase sigma factor [Longimicrobiales bacterium]
MLAAQAKLEAVSEAQPASLVERAQRGERGAFESLYREHVGRVHALCLRMSGDRGRAEELTQDVFVRAWSRLGSFRGDAAFGTWLHRIAVNAVLQKRRSDRRREQRVETREMLEHEAPVTRERPAERMDLERAIAGLPEGAKAVFLLHDVHGYKHHEIADMLGIAVGTTKAQLHRARRLLREAL